MSITSPQERNVDDNGFTTPTAICQLRAVIYEVVAGKECEIDYFKKTIITLLMAGLTGQREISCLALEVFGLVPLLKAAGLMGEGGSKMRIACYEH